MIIRPINSPDELDEIYHLTYRRYLEQGYCNTKADARLACYPHLDRDSKTTVYVAERYGIIGTVTVTLDGEAKLHCDDSFPSETEVIRQECIKNGRTLASGWRIVTTAAHESALALHLVNKVVEICCSHPIHTILVDPNPKHEDFYRKALGFRPISRGPCLALPKSPPAVLMRADLEDVVEKWARFRNRNILKL